MRSLRDIDVMILAGGLGTRIREVLPDTPKLLIPVSGRPFIEYLFDWLRFYGANRVVLCLGYLADMVQRYLDENPPQGLTVDISVEPEPLGTAGAIRYAAPLLSSDPVMVINGDSFADVDLGGFLNAHCSGGWEASLVCTEVPDCSRFGTVELGADNSILRFVEKGSRERLPGHINGGIYLFSRNFIGYIAKMRGASLEYDVFAVQPPGTLRAYVGAFRFIDLGTPESYRQATAGMVSVDRGISADRS